MHKSKVLIRGSESGPKFHTEPYISNNAYSTLRVKQLDVEYPHPL